MDKGQNKAAQKTWFTTGRLLLIYDICALIVSFILMWLLAHADSQTVYPLLPMLLFVSTDIVFRCILRVYKQIWRYGGVSCYVRILMADFCAFCIAVVINYLLLPYPLSFLHLIAFYSFNALCVLASRLFYRYCYKTGKFTRLIRLASFGKTSIDSRGIDHQKIKVAIVGAGRVGVDLAESFLTNPNSVYEPRFFIDINSMKAGRIICNLPVFPETSEIFDKLKAFEIQEIILAVSGPHTKKKDVYDLYRNAGYPVKLYDYPVLQSVSGKRVLREFDIEDLLFRKPQVIISEAAEEYYRDKVILITGGGGSIGSELCRQVAKMKPRQLILLDIYENGVYDVQQEMKILYGDQLDIRIVIVSVCNRAGLERTFREYRPQVVVHAAAHKHVPLMENDCIEAVENNVFGTLNTLELAEQYGAERFILVSTDKAVNPTNVMGATKRMCEMLVLNHQGSMVCSATRFGNVLGSAGSVIPLFKKQIASGGPITITDKRIIRYFMTIPEASQLVLQSGVMAKDKELFVLDMGSPVRIMDLIENMLRLSGQTDIPIVEIGLRPGEKLYEELLVRTEELDKTENELIFIERDKPVDPLCLHQKLAILCDAVAAGSDSAAKEALKDVVPTYRTIQDPGSQTADVKELQLASAAM